MYYKEYGTVNSSLMIFIHGGGVSSWMWDKQIEYFSSKYHCLVPDMPEHGRSKNGIKFAISNTADALNQLIELKRDGKQVIAVGFSLGAQVLISMLSKKPNSIDFAMINSALVKPVPFSNLLIKSMVYALPLVKLKTFSKIQAASMYIDAEYQNIYFLESSQIKKETFVRTMNENMSFEIPGEFKNSSSNILVTAGEKERKVIKNSMKEIAKSNSNCKTLIFPKVGHGFSLAHPKLFNIILEEWMESGFHHMM